MAELIVLCTVSTAREGRRIAEGVINARLAACVNVLPGLWSCYRWQGKREAGREVLLLIKTTKAVIRPLMAKIRALHSYRVPEMLALPIAMGNSDYLAWMRESIGREAARRRKR
jgi:periplasmic divalent cation tolerance protein